MGAYERNGKPCVALVEPAPATVICAVEDVSDQDMVMTAATRPASEGVGELLIWGWAPRGTTQVKIQVADVTKQMAVRDAGERFAGRAYFIVTLPYRDGPISGMAYDSEGRETASRRLGN